ncbi:MAG TPA: HupE/UreJ family protein [Spongiibacteraceae bacterium]|nr:HupE/UreJ family protein [Spongiibacteraceae bacterium]
MSKKLISVLLLTFPTIALAHPGHTNNFAAAFVHPFTGIDHLLMMLCVGILAGRIGGAMRWRLPLAFLSAMSMGWLLGAAGYAFKGLESGIAAGLIALGALFITRATLPAVLQVGMIAMFALLHGMAHGVELSSLTPTMTGAGFLMATALLHAAGLVIASLIPSAENRAYRALGVALSVLGSGLLLTA